MARDSLGIGFIGAGWMGRVHGHALRTLDHLAPLTKQVRLVAVAGRTPTRVERLAGELGFERWTTRWQEVVEDPRVDVVANLATVDVHAEPSIAALQLGKPVLCEKPLAPSAAEARRMLRAAEAAAVTHACAF